MTARIEYSWNRPLELWKATLHAVSSDVRNDLASLAPKLYIAAIHLLSFNAWECQRIARCAHSDLNERVALGLVSESEVDAVFKQIVGRFHDCRNYTDAIYHTPLITVAVHAFTYPTYFVHLPQKELLVVARINLCAGVLIAYETLFAPEQTMLKAAMEIAASHLLARGSSLVYQASPSVRTFCSKVTSVATGAASAACSKVASAVRWCFGGCQSRRD